MVFSVINFHLKISLKNDVYLERNCQLKFYVIKKTREVRSTQNKKLDTRRSEYFRSRSIFLPRLLHLAPL